MTDAPEHPTNSDPANELASDRSPIDPRDFRSALGTFGMVVTRRAAGNAASRWIPALGAAAVASYAYWDTLQVAKTARRLLEPPPVED